MRGLLCAAVLVGACTSGNEDAGPVRTTVPPGETTTSSSTTIITVAGRPRTTTTNPVDLAPGDAKLAGTVYGPQGPISGATVRVERLVGSEVSTRDVQSSNGTWELPSIRGGRYRVRAWRAPDLAQLEPEIFFLAANESRIVDLRLTALGDLRVSADVTPNPPPLGQPSTLTVSVLGGTVNGDGAVSLAGRPGQEVRIAAVTGAILQSPDRATTDANGNASFRVLCLQAGALAADAIIANLSYPLELPPCGGGRR